LAATLETGRGGPEHSGALDGIRGLAVFMVFFTHYQPWIDKWIPMGTTTAAISRILGDLGNAGVDLFFVLSGYLIYGTLIRRPQPFGPFMARRLQRLYPTFLVVLLLALPFTLGSLKAMGGGAIGHLVANLLLLPGIFPIDPIIIVAWTLSWEMFFYLVTPAMIGALRLRSQPPPRRAAIMVSIWLGMAISSGLTTGVGNFRIAYFAGGVAVFEVVNALRDRSTISPRAIGAMGLGSTVVWLGFTAATSAALPFDARTGAIDVSGSDGLLWARYGVGLVLVPVIVFSCIAGTGSLASILSTRFFRWLGNMSYSYYLLHALVIRAVAEVAMRLVDPSQHLSVVWWWAALLPVFAATVVASFVLFATVEKPCSLSSDPPVRVVPPAIRRLPFSRSTTNP